MLFKENKSPPGGEVTTLGPSTPGGPRMPAQLCPGLPAHRGCTTIQGFMEARSTGPEAQLWACFLARDPAKGFPVWLSACRTAAMLHGAGCSVTNQRPLYGTAFPTGRAQESTQWHTLGSAGLQSPPRWAHSHQGTWEESHWTCQLWLPPQHREPPRPREQLTGGETSVLSTGGRLLARRVLLAP